MQDNRRSTTAHTCDNTSGTHKASRNEMGVIVVFFHSIRSMGSCVYYVVILTLEQARA